MSVAVGVGRKPCIQRPPVVCETLLLLVLLQNVLIQRSQILGDVFAYVRLVGVFRVHAYS